MGDTTQRLHVAVLIASVAVAVFVFVHAPAEHVAPVTTPARAAARAPLDFVPAGATLVATIDLDRIRQSRLGAILAGPGRELPGVGRLTDVCGFDPTEQVSEIIVAVPHAPDDAAPDVGVIALGDYPADRIVACARAVIAKRGGTPVATRLGSFTSVRDRSREGGEIATRPGGPTLLAGGSYLRDLVDVADRAAPSLAKDALHRALRGSVDAHSAVIASCVLERDWLEHALGTALVRASPLSRVRAIAVGIDVTPRVTVRAVVGCDNLQACRDVAARLDEFRRRDLDAWLRQRLDTDADLANRIAITSADKEVDVSLDLPPEEAAKLLGRALGE